MYYTHFISEYDVLDTVLSSKRAGHGYICFETDNLNLGKHLRRSTRTLRGCVNGKQLQQLLEELGHGCSDATPDRADYQGTQQGVDYACAAPPASSLEHRSRPQARELARARR